MPKNTQKLIEGKLQLLNYHRNSMSERRAIGFKAFLSLIGFQMLGIKGSSTQ